MPRFAFSPEVRRRLRQSYGLEKRFVIGHVGRFNVQKNHSRLLDIFAETAKAVPGASLVLIGVGELEQAAKEKAKALAIEDKVLFLGQMANVGEWYQAMDCFVLPSLFEGLPVVGIEAQAAGLPCFFSENVTDEVLISPDARRISLGASDAEWAKEIMAAGQAEKDRTGGTGLVRRAGYDIHSEARRLQDLYLEMADRAYPEKQPRI